MKKEIYLNLNPCMQQQHYHFFQISLPKMLSALITTLLDTEDHEQMDTYCKLIVYIKANNSDQNFLIILIFPQY